MKQETRESVIRILRRVGLLRAYDRLKFCALVAREFQANRAFRRIHPDFPVPPLSLCYDAFAHIQLRDYLETGRRHARFLAEVIRQQAPRVSPLEILEWGCGPARVLRHLRQELNRPCKLAGADYNPRTIAWCRRHLPDVDFRLNQLEPPLPFAAGQFDIIYALSVFTHLSEAMHLAWIEELRRVLKPGGLLLLTLHGDYYRERHLRDGERAVYDAGGLVVRGGVMEGKKWFAAFHSPRFVRERLLDRMEIVQHRPSPLPGSIEQDLWVARRRIT